MNGRRIRQPIQHRSNKKARTPYRACRRYLSKRRLCATKKSRNTVEGSTLPVPAQSPIIWIAKDDAALFGEHTNPSRNSRVRQVEANSDGNPLSYPILVFTDNDEKELNEHTHAVLLYKNHWYEAEFSKNSHHPYLGARRDEIHYYNIPPSPKPKPESEPKSDSTDSSKKSIQEDTPLNEEIR